MAVTPVLVHGPSCSNIHVHIYVYTITLIH
jgi:hypothetical protein